MVWPSIPIPGSIPGAILLNDLSPLDLVSPTPANRQAHALGVETEVLRANVNDFITLANEIPDYFLERDGVSAIQFMRSDLSLNSYRITDLAVATAVGDLITRSAWDTEWTRTQDISVGFASHIYLLHSGIYDMQNNLDLGGQRILDIAAPTLDENGVAKLYVDSQFLPVQLNTLFLRADGIFAMQANLNMGSNSISSGTGPITNDTVVTKSYMDSEMPTVPSPEPAGLVRPFAAIATVSGTIPAIPENWALCNGQTVDTRVFPDLWIAIGDAFGSPASFSINLPDTRGRIVAHLDEGGWGYQDSRLRSADSYLSPAINTWAGVIGGTGGPNMTTITIDTMGRHWHGMTHATWSTSATGSNLGNASHPLNTWSATSAGVFSTDYTGSVPAAPHHNHQPKIFTGYIIKLTND